MHGSSRITYDPSVIKPPPLRTLLEDTAFRRYMKTLPSLPDNLSWGKPWAVIALRTDGKWMMAKYARYPQAWMMTVRLVRDTNIEDVSLVSRRRLFTPPTRTEEYKVRVRARGLTAAKIETRRREVPVLAHLIEYPYAWCVRCRRPSSFEQFTRHHAIPRNVPIDEGAPRCVFCGMRLAS
jgi:hypothetical protein